MVGKAALVCGGLAVCFASSASGEVIAFTHAGQASGSLAGVAFGSTEFVIHATANTRDRRQITSTIYAITHKLATVEIEGVGVFEIETRTETWVNQFVRHVGVARAMGSDLFDGPFSTEFQTWDMLSGIGPIAGSGEVLQWNDDPVETSGGVLEFDDIRSTFASFEAHIVPAPAAGWAAIGVVCLTARRRR